MRQVEPAPGVEYLLDNNGAIVGTVCVLCHDSAIERALSILATECTINPHHSIEMIPNDTRQALAERLTELPDGWRFKH